MKTNRTYYLFATLILGVVGALPLSAGCSTKLCLIEEDCFYGCETDEDCDRSELDGTAPLCMANPYNGDKNCSHKCSDSTKCVCVCVDSPKEGYCLVGGTVRNQHLCEADRPSIAEMCDKVYRTLPCCAFTPSKLDVCKSYEETYSSCTSEIDALFFCAYRISSGKDLCEQITMSTFDQGPCANEIAAADACTGVPWNQLRLDWCFGP